VTDSTGNARQIARDAWLVVRCQLGERESFDALIDRWHGPLWTYARRVTGADDAAHDVVQDVWLRVLRGLPGLRDPLRLRPWLFGIARRVLMDRLRAQYAAPAASEVDPDTVSIAGPTEGSADELEADAAALQAGLDRLPVVEREVLTLFYLHELSLAEVAELLAVPVGTVKSRLHRARRMLRRAIASAEGNRS
jgi:RNA polymerase sigma-70 factor (ECF subfamily)